MFRAPQGDPIVSDWISTTALLGGLNEQVGRGRVLVNGELDIDRFRRQNQLDSVAHTLSLEGDWATVGDLSGELGHTDSAQLFRYSPTQYIAQTSKNTLETRTSFAHVHLGVVSRLTLNLTVDGLDQTYSAPAYQFEDLTRWRNQAQLAYQVAGDLSLSLAYARTHGAYPNYSQTLDPASGDLVSSPDDFHRRDLILGASYNPGGASRLNFQVGRAHEQHSALSERSYSSWNGLGEWAWTPTGRSRLTLDLSRDNDTGSADVYGLGLPLSSTDVTRRTTLTGKFAYDLTGKIQLTANATLARRQLDTTAVLDGASLPDQASDRLTQFTLGMNYQVTRTVQLGCSATREQRLVFGQSATIVTYPYFDRTLACQAQLALD